MRCLLILLGISGVLSAQSMMEASAVIAGSTVGSAAGKKLSDGINSTLKTTGGILDKAAKTGDKGSPAVPALKVSPGRVKSQPVAEPNNVPPPPPPARRASSRPVQRSVPVPVVMSAPLPVAPPAPRNVDLNSISQGMLRTQVLELGNPTARITMFEDGHLVEIYHYQNETLASGRVRLRDGAVAAVEARP